MPNWPKRDVISVLVVFWRAAEGKNCTANLEIFPYEKAKNTKSKIRASVWIS